MPKAKILALAMPLAILVFIVARTKGFDPWSYDRDGDGTISMSEAIEAVHDCSMGKITEAQREIVMQLWKTGVIKV